MTKRLVVVLDRVEQATANVLGLKELVQPRTTVDLLVPAMSQQCNWAIAYLTASATHHTGAVQICEREWAGAIASEIEHAERALTPLREALAAAGAELRLHLYTGPLRKALRELQEIHEFPMVVIRLRRDRGLRKLFRSVRRLFGWLPKPPVEAELALRR